MRRTLEWVEYTDTITCSWQCEWSLCLEHIDFVLNSFNSGSWMCLGGPGNRYKIQLLKKLPVQTNRDDCLRVDTNTNWKQLWLLAHEVAWGIPSWKTWVRLWVQVGEKERLHLSPTSDDQQTPSSLLLVNLAQILSSRSQNTLAEACFMFGFLACMIVL